MSEQIFHDSSADFTHRAKWWTSRTLIYGALILWAFIEFRPDPLVLASVFSVGTVALSLYLLPRLKDVAVGA